MEKSFSVETQVGPCGITCGTCFLGNGTMAKTMGEASQYISMSGIKEWSPLVPGGSDIDWVETEKALDWMKKYAFCAGCEAGGGPPDCTIRNCASEKGYELCNQCDELDTCEKFDWLGEVDGLKDKLRQNNGRSKLEIAREALKQGS